MHLEDLGANIPLPLTFRKNLGTKDNWAPDFQWENSCNTWDSQSEKAHKTSRSEFSKQKMILPFSQESGETRQTDAGQNWDHSTEYRIFFPPEKQAGQEVTPFGLARSKDVKLIKKSV